jgi:hypothetical protein
MAATCWHTQMSSLRWLEAGATASYGTVSEPCNHWQKFPHPSVLLRHYAARRHRHRSLLAQRGLAGPGTVHRRAAGGAVRAAIIYCCKLSV